MSHKLESNSILYDVDYVKIVKEKKHTRKTNNVGLINNDQKDIVVE